MTTQHKNFKNTSGGSGNDALQMYPLKNPQILWNCPFNFVGIICNAYVEKKIRLDQPTLIRFCKDVGMLQNISWI